MGETLRRIRFLLRTSRERADLDEEMRLHVALRVEQLRSKGTIKEDAERSAQASARLYPFSEG